MKKAIIYVRVSKASQDVQRQITDLEKWATMNGFEVMETFEDVTSGKTKASKRTGAKAMFQHLENNKIDIVLTTEISRLGRSAIDVQKNIDKIVNQLGIDLFIHMQNLRAKDTNGNQNSVFKLITDVLANVAQMEREQISERVKSGLRQAKANGKTLGRPIGATQDNKQVLKKYRKVVKELDKGLSLRKVAKLCDVSVNTVRKVQTALSV